MKKQLPFALLLFIVSCGEIGIRSVPTFPSEPSSIHIPNDPVPATEERTFLNLVEKTYRLSAQTLTTMPPTRINIIVDNSQSMAKQTLESFTNGVERLVGAVAQTEETIEFNVYSIQKILNEQSSIESVDAQTEKTTFASKPLNPAVIEFSPGQSSSERNLAISELKNLIVTGQYTNSKASGLGVVLRILSEIGKEKSGYRQAFYIVSNRNDETAYREVPVSLTKHYGTSKERQTFRLLYPSMKYTFKLALFSTDANGQIVKSEVQAFYATACNTNSKENGFCEETSDCSPNEIQAIARIKKGEVVEGSCSKVASQTWVSYTVEEAGSVSCSEVSVIQNKTYANLFEYGLSKTGAVPLDCGMNTQVVAPTTIEKEYYFGEIPEGTSAETHLHNALLNGLEKAFPNPDQYLLCGTVPGGTEDGYSKFFSLVKGFTGVTGIQEEDYSRVMQYIQNFALESIVRTYTLSSKPEEEIQRVEILRAGLSSPLVLDPSDYKVSRDESDTASIQFAPGVLTFTDQISVFTIESL